MGRLVQYKYLRTSNAKDDNVNHHKPTNISDSLRRKIRKWNSLDAKLYTLARSHLLNLSRTTDAAYYLQSRHAHATGKNETFTETIVQKLKRLELDLGVKNPPQSILKRLDGIEDVFF